MSSDFRRHSRPTYNTPQPYVTYRNHYKKPLATTALKRYTLPMPPIKETESTLVAVRIQDPLLKDIDRLAQAHGRSRSDVIRTALVRIINAYTYTEEPPHHVTDITDHQPTQSPYL